MDADGTTDVDTDDPPTVKMFVRPAAPRTDKQLRALRERLEALADAGLIGGVDVETWEGRLLLETGETPPRAVEWFHRFQEWARRNDRALGPSFGHSHPVSSFTGERYEEFVFPVVCVAVLRGDDVLEVIPRIEGGRHLRVADWLAAFADERAAERQPPETDNGEAISGPLST